MSAVDSVTTVRPYHEGDERALVELFARVFGKPISEDHWRWKLRTGPAPAENVWLAVHGDAPVFQYAATAQRYRIAGRDVIGMVSVDTMTHPDFRRRGLLTRVATEAYGAWRSAGAAFVIGLPNQQWGSRTQALGWEELFTLQWLGRPLRPHALAARRLRQPWLRRLGFLSAPWNRWHQRHWRRDPTLVIERAVRAGPDFDQLWRQLEPRQTFGVIRDSAWVNWRFIDSPTRRYEVLAARRGAQLSGYAAYALTRSEDRIVAFLAELVASDAHTREQLLGHLVERLLAAGAESLVTLSITDSEEARWLRTRGFFKAAGFSVQVVPLATGLPLADMKRAANWRMSGADFDVI